MELLLKRTTPDDLQSQKQLSQYFVTNVKPLFSSLITSIVKNKPEDILQYSIKWFRDKKGLQKINEENTSQSDSELAEVQIVPDEIFKKIRQQKLQKGRKKRIGFSSQKCCRGSIKVQNGQKKQEQTYMRILFFCMNSFLFRNFSQKQINELIQKMKKQIFQGNVQICTEGEYGDRMYFVEQGMFQCVQFTQQGPKVLKYYHVGDTFGQICLLHMVKRQASIFSRGDYNVVYTLDRQSYIHFRKMCTIKKRAMYLYTLVKQQLFSSFSQQQLEKICDVLTEVSYQQGDIVINQGDVGSKFYIIIDGILVAFKGTQDNIVQCYKQGDAFGQIALIKDKPRQASVKALTRSKLVYMTRDVFRRIFENVNLEKQIDQKYMHKGNLILKRRYQNNQQKSKHQKQIILARRGSIKTNSINQDLLYDN